MLFVAFGCQDHLFVHAVQICIQRPHIVSILKDLRSNANARYEQRLQCLIDHLSGAWLTAFPSSALRLSFSPMEFRRLLKWWLGLPQSSNPSIPSQCNFCQQPMDIFGDHSVSCNAISCVPRHNLVAQALASAASTAGITIDREVAVAGKERPADLLLKGLASSLLVAVDVTVVHPLVSFDQGSDAPAQQTLRTPNTATTTPFATPPGLISKP